MCILCGVNHPKGAPCDFTGVDSILSGKVTIPPEIIEEPKIEKPLNFEPKKDKKWTSKLRF